MDARYYDLLNCLHFPGNQGYGITHLPVGTNDGQRYARLFIFVDRRYVLGISNSS